MDSATPPDREGPPSSWNDRALVRARRLEERRAAALERQARNRERRRGPSAAAATVPANAPAIGAGDAASSDPRLFADPHQGENYIVVLGRLHAMLQPERYLEIGIRHGTSLAQARCASIGVDPNHRLAEEVLSNKPVGMIFRETSDDFFATRDPKALLGGPLDMAFLDGMHLFEYLLRDVINTEPHCAPTGMLVLHDCLPTDVAMTRRQPRYTEEAGPARRPGAWAGDVWKLVPVLRRYRPDLRLTILDAPPTGLVLVTNLDPGNTVLKDNYQAILAEFLPLDLREIGIRAYLSQQQAIPTRMIRTRDDLERRFSP